MALAAVFSLIANSIYTFVGHSSMEEASKPPVTVLRDQVGRIRTCISSRPEHDPLLYVPSSKVLGTIGLLCKQITAEVELHTLLEQNRKLRKEIATEQKNILLDCKVINRAYGNSQEVKERTAVREKENAVSRQELLMACEAAEEEVEKLQVRRRRRDNRDPQNVIASDIPNQAFEHELQCLEDEHYCRELWEGMQKLEERMYR